MVYTREDVSIQTALNGGIWIGIAPVSILVR
jgi:hypothetical protein